MTILAILAIVEAVALVAVVLILTHSHGGQMLELHARETADRRELLNRIQAPDRIVPTQTSPVELPDEEPDESALVGAIRYDERYGTDDGEGE